MSVKEKLFPRTFESLNKILFQLKVIQRVFLFSAFVFFSAYYIYQISINTSKTAFLIIYIVLLSLTAITSVIDIIFAFNTVDKETRKKYRNARIWIKSVKWTAKVVALSISLFELVKFGGSDLQIMLYILAVVLFFVDIVLTFIVRLARADVELMIESIKEDMERFNFVSKGQEVVDKIATGVDKIKNFFR